MEKKNRARLFSLIAGILILLTIVSCCIEVTIGGNYVKTPDYSPAGEYYGSQMYGDVYYTPTIIPTVFSLGILAMGFSIPLFLKKKLPALIAAAIAAAICVLLINIEVSVGFNVDSRTGYSAFSFSERALVLASFAILIVLIALAMKNNKAVCAIWYLPAVFFLAGTAVGFGNAYYDYEWLTHSATLITGTAALAFIGLWLREEVRLPKPDRKAEPLPVYCVPAPDADAQLPADSGDAGEQLRKYKELLDDGLITQEDYDAKKKEILGL